MLDIDPQDVEQHLNDGWSLPADIVISEKPT